MDYGAHRRNYRQRHRARYRMAGLYKFRREAAKLHLVPWLYNVQLCVLHALLFKLVLNKRAGKLCAVNRGLKLL